MNKVLKPAINFSWSTLGIEGQRECPLRRDRVTAGGDTNGNVKPGVPNDWHSYEFAEIVDQSSISRGDTIVPRAILIFFVGTPCFIIYTGEGTNRRKATGLYCSFASDVRRGK